MGNTLLTPTTITRKAQMILHQKLNFIPNIVTDYDDKFANDGAKIGNSIAVRLPNEFTTATGPSLSVQDVPETSTTLTVNTQRHVDFTFSSNELTMTIDDFAERYLEPAMSVLASKIEADAMSMLLDVPNAVDYHGSATTLAHILAGGVKLDNALAPRDNKRTAILNAQASADLVTDTKGLFQAATAIAEQYREGQMGRTAGFNFFQNTLVPSLTNGPASSLTGYLINAASTLSGSSLPVDNGSQTFVPGEIITIAGVYEIHPETKTSYGVLKQFVITAAVSSVATGIQISPSIVAEATGRQNVSTGLANNATITKVGGANSVMVPSILFHKNAFCFGTADLIMPDDVSFKARRVKDGISMRMLRQYTIADDQMPCRIDVLYGYKTLRPTLACKVYNNGT